MRLYKFSSAVLFGATLTLLLAPPTALAEAAEAVTAPSNGPATDPTLPSMAAPATLLPSASAEPADSGYRTLNDGRLSAFIHRTSSAGGT